MARAPERQHFPRRPFLLCAAIVALPTLLAFWPVGRYPFLTTWDDGLYVLGNDMVKAGVSPAGLRWAFTAFAAANWHPLTWLSHMLDVELFGLDAGAHHLVSLGLHVTAALLLLAVLARLTGRLWRSTMVSLLFAIHPLHVESVVRVSTRKDVLAALFWMLTIAAYVRYVRRPGARRYLLVVGAFALGLMAKPTVVALPLVLLLLDFWPLARFPSCRPTAGAACAPRSMPALERLLREKVPLFALAAAGSALTWVAQATYGKSAVSLQVIPLPLRLANAAVSCAAYLAGTLLPLRQAFFYPYPLDGYPVWQVAGTAALLTAVSVLALRQRQRRPQLLLGWCWYLATLLPVIGIVQVGVQARADRYTYLPLVGVFVMLVWGAADLAPRLPGRRATAVSAGCLAAVLCTVSTRAEVGYWRDTETLTRRALAVTSGNWIARENLGYELTRQGREEEGLQQYREAEKSVPARAERHFRRGEQLAAAGDNSGAAAEYRQAVELYPPCVMANFNLAQLELASGDTVAAARHLRAAIAYRPDFLEAHFARGMILAKRGELEPAAAHFAEVVKFQPDYPGARHNLELLLQGLGLTRERFEDYLRDRSQREERGEARF
jgi:tetratricopeptide (TPR) repeat protein